MCPVDHDRRVADARSALERCYLYGGGDYDSIASSLDELASRPSTPPSVQAAVLVVRGMALHYATIELEPDARALADPDIEQAFFAEALRMRDAGDETIAGAQFGLGLVQQVLRADFAAAAPHFQVAFELMSRSGRLDATLLGSEIVRHLGFDELIRNDNPPGAIELLTTSLSIRERLDEPGWTASGHRALALAHRRGGHAILAVEHATRALEIAERLRLHTSHIDAARTDLETARAA